MGMAQGGTQSARQEEAPGRDLRSVAFLDVSAVGRQEADWKLEERGPVLARSAHSLGWPIACLLLHARSLFGPGKFPVLSRRELDRKSLNPRCYWTVSGPANPSKSGISLFFSVFAGKATRRLVRM